MRSEGPDDAAVDAAAFDGLRAFAGVLAASASDPLRRDDGNDAASRHAALHWAAARAAVVAAARARLERIGVPAEGALFADLVDGADAPQQQAFAQLRDPTLRWSKAAPTFAQLGAAYPLLLTPAARKRAGSWFTAQSLAAPTARRVLAPLLPMDRPLRIGDPAVGAGAFLLAALQVRVDAGAAAAEVASRELFGVDRDPTAAQLAAWVLREACGDDPPAIAAIERNVRCGDGLFAFDDASFDAVLGNPPWETLQTARADTAAESERRLADRIAALRARFRLQGSGKLYTYRLFVERALALLRPGGRLGLIVPASLYFDRDAAALRQRLLDECQWEWLFAFENRRRLFAIDSRYRFGPIVAEVGGRTTAVRAAFLRDDPAEWAADEPPHLLYRSRDVRLLSPHSGAFVELRTERDLDLLRRLVAAGEPLLGRAGACAWRQGDYNMTSDSHLFLRCSDCERSGYARAVDGTWRRNAGDRVLRPLYQGAMIHDLDPNAGAFAGGVGRGVRWQQPRRGDQLQPQYLVDAADHRAAPARVALRALSNATNERSAIACLLADEPCGNSLGVLTPRRTSATPIGDAAFTAGVLGSLVWDWALRQRLAGTNVNGFVLADTVLPRCDAARRAHIATLALRLCAVLPWHAGSWRLARDEGWLEDPPAHGAPPNAPDQTTRRELHARLDAAVARAFGLGASDLGWMLRDCDRPIEDLRDRRATRQLDPKGFWRVDRNLPAAQRRTMRALAWMQRADPVGARTDGCATKDR